MTSMSDHGRSCASVFDSISSVADAPPMMSPVVLTRLRLQASPINVAAWAFSPAVATMTTRSAPSTSSIRSFVRLARKRRRGKEARVVPVELREVLDYGLARPIERDHLDVPRLRVRRVDAE